MACEYICDGCGQRASATRGGLGWFKPYEWFQRSDTDGPQDACSRVCIDRIAAKSGKTRVILSL